MLILFATLLNIPRYDKMVSFDVVITSADLANQNTNIINIIVNSTNTFKLMRRFIKQLCHIQFHHDNLLQLLAKIRQKLTAVFVGRICVPFARLL